MRNRVWTLSGVLRAGVLLAAVATGCGDASIAAEVGPPIELRLLDRSPGCYEEPPPELIVPPELTDTQTQMAEAARQMQEFGLSFDAQRIQLVTQPIVEDPTARRWSRSIDGGFIEGQVIAEGTGWSVLRMVASIPGSQVGDDPGFIAATINVTPVATEYDFDDQNILVRDNGFITNELFRGCDEKAGVSFEEGPFLEPESSQLRPQVRCWPASIRMPVGQSTDSKALEEFQASISLQCLQIIEKARTET